MGYVLLLHLRGLCVVSVSLCVCAWGQQMIDGGSASCEPDVSTIDLSSHLKARVFSTQYATLTVSSLFQMGNDSLALMEV